MSDPADSMPDLDEAAFTAAVDRAARELARAEAAMSEHPSVDELVDYQEKHLVGESAERVRRHLATCRPCARELRELEAFDAEPVTDSEPSNREEMAAGWARFQDAVAGDVGHGVAGADVLEMPPAGERERRSAGARRLRDRLAMAASLAVGLIGLGLWLAAQRALPPETSETARSEPRHLHAFDLLPDGEHRVRDAADVTEVVVPAATDALVPRLNLGDQTPYPAYHAEMVDEAGVVVWSQDDLRRQPAGEFVVLVERAEIAASRYRLRVFGLEGDHKTTLATYTFELRDAPEP